MVLFLRVLAPVAFEVAVELGSDLFEFFVEILFPPVELLSGGISLLLQHPPRHHLEPYALLIEVLDVQCQGFQHVFGLVVRKWSFFAALLNYFDDFLDYAHACFNKI